MTTEKTIPPVLSWNEARPAKDATTMNLLIDGRLAEWMLEADGDRGHWRAWKLAYEQQSEWAKWVPLRGTFQSLEAAQAGVEEYLAAKKTVFLDAKGRVIQS